MLKCEKSAIPRRIAVTKLRWQAEIDKLYREKCVNIRVPGGKNNHWWSIVISRPFKNFEFKYPNYQLFALEFILWRKLDSMPLERQNFFWSELKDKTSIGWPATQRKQAMKEMRHFAIELARRLGQKQLKLHVVFNSKMTQVAVISTSIYIRTIGRRKLLFTD